MARADWVYYSGRCSYKRTTILICTVNIVVALFVLRSLYTSVYIYDDSHTTVRYTPDQIRKMQESMRIRQASEPLELMKLVNEMKQEPVSEGKDFELPRHLRLKITDEILGRLRGLPAEANLTQQREAVESWRKEKLEEAKQRTALKNGNAAYSDRGKNLNTTIRPDEAGMLARALESSWAQLSEDIGLWIPVQIINQEHDDKPEGAEEEEEEILPGRKLPPECHTELHTDYDGAAVRWGLTHNKESAYECCQACFDQARHAKPGEKKCNIWVYCPSERGCYSPDIYEHKLGECWLKYAENPRLNFKNQYSESYRNAHPNAPLVVPWVSGVTTA